VHHVGPGFGQQRLGGWKRGGARQLGEFRGGPLSAIVDADHDGGNRLPPDGVQVLARHLSGPEERDAKRPIDEGLSVH
jgi:hypothetical protein